MELSRIEQGSLDGQTLVFVHGWPDDARLWEGVVAALEDGFRCVRVTLPGFGDSPGRDRGYAFDELVDALRETIEVVRRPGERVILVTHDWGAWLGYLLERAHPDLVEAMICCDVGAHIRPERVLHAVGFLAYQWALAGCWSLGRWSPRAADRLTRRIARAIDVPDRQAASVRARANYPYHYFWRSMLLRNTDADPGRNYQPRCPTLFLYGQRKPFPFHSDEWLSRVTATGGQSVGIDGGHWFVESRAAEVAAEIRRWLSAR